MLATCVQEKIMSTMKRSKRTNADDNIKKKGKRFWQKLYYNIPIETGMKTLMT